ncbi:MAG TPA: SRPBCC family protein [Candidatus Dormibacteraeota bacterium]
MVITTRFDLGAPVDAAWAYLLDVPKIAHCVPGASLTDVVDDKTYAGKVEVKLGPIGVSYKGQITIESTDPTTHTVRVKAEGAETRGRGGASAVMTAQLEAKGEGTTVVMTTDLSVSGVVAQFGRTGIIQEVAQRMANRFASCVDQELKTATPAG